MITAQEARITTNIASATKKLELFERSIRDAADKGQTSIIIKKHEMPVLGVEAFRKLGYIVTEDTKSIEPHPNSTSCLAIREVIAYNISWTREN